MNPNKRAFTLIEMLVVMAIMTILIALVVPAFTGISESRSLSDAGATIVALLDDARQKAIASSRTIEVRIYKLGSSTSDLYYNSIQTFEVQPDGTVKASDKAQTFSVSVAIAQDQSTLIKEATITGNTTDKNTPANTYSVAGRTGVGYVAFRFNPSGSTNLPPKSPAGYSWYLTLINRKNLGQVTAVATAPAKNYAAIQMDPISGTTKVFRP